MSWVTVIWSMTASACLTLASLHVLIWCRQRKAWANLAFALTAVAAAAFAVCELWMMRSATSGEMACALKCIQVPAWVLIVSLVFFVRFFLRAGRPWLARAIVGLRTFALVLNFLTGQNINYREITQLQHIRFLGETVSTPAGTVNPWMLVAQLSLWLLIFFTLDAAISVWRKGDRRQALWVGGGILFFELAGTVQAVLVVGQITPVPFMVSFFYMGIVMGMGYELSRDVLCAVQLGHDLRESEKRLSMAADAAKLGIWVRELTKNEIWATENWRQLFGFTKTEPLTLDLFLQRLHPDDRDGVHQALTQLNNNNPHYEKEYRILPLAGQIRWIASRGRAEFDGAGKPVLVRGVSVDITHRKQAELEAQSRREELAHLSRVTMLGELSGSLAHELNQPLTAILSNAQAAQRFLSRDDADLNEVREILADIVSEDKRAGEVISRLRVLLKKGEAQHQSLDLNEVVQEALKLVRNDLFNHAVSAHLELARDLPAVKADRVQLQQVLQI